MTTDSQTQSAIQGAMPTIYVSDLNRAVAFYTETLGLKLLQQAGDHFAMIDAGRGSCLGLHPTGPKSPKAGRSGSISVGLNVAQPIEEVLKALEAKGVVFRGPIVNDGPVKLASFGDPDGNDLYLCEYDRP